MLVGEPRYDDEGALKRRQYKRELHRLQEELMKLQYWMKKRDLWVCIVFERRGATGKGGVIKRITYRPNSQVTRAVVFGEPTEQEQGRWYFRRYVRQLLMEGKVVLFGWSWYSRTGVRRAVGFCTDEEYEELLRTYPEFE